MPANAIGPAVTTDGLGTSPHSPSPHPPEDARPTILVVDDRAINRDFLVSLLNCSGYRTVEARSPTELPAVEHLDLIITGVQVPGMDGLVFPDALRAEPITRHLPVILYTATYKTKNIDDLAKAKGAFAVLTKPTAPEKILEEVRAALKSNSAKSPLATPNTEDFVGAVQNALGQVAVPQET